MKLFNKPSQPNQSEQSQTEKHYSTANGMELAKSSQEKLNQTEEFSEEFSEDQATSETYSTDAPDHFDDLIDDEIEHERAQEIEQLSSEMLECDAFHQVFCTGFTTASYLTGLKSLAVDKNSGEAKACTQALYDTIRDIPALHFLLMPQSVWLERAIAIGSLTVPMAIGVSNEIKAKKGAGKTTKEPQQPENVMTGNLREMAKRQE